MKLKLILLSLIIIISTSCSKKNRGFDYDKHYRKSIKYKKEHERGFYRPCQRHKHEAMNFPK
jgi:hypothetical protein